MTKICDFPTLFRDGTIRKVMGVWGWGGGGKKPKKIHARENAKKKNSRKEGKEKKFMQKEGPIVTVI